MVGDTFDDPDDPIVAVKAGWKSDCYGEPALEAWLRHVKKIVGRSPIPKRLQEAVKEWPILKDARAFLPGSDYVALVSTINPEYRKGLRADDAEVA